MMQNWPKSMSFSRALPYHINGQINISIKQRVGDMLRDHLARRAHEFGVATIHVAVVQQRTAQRAETVDLRWKVLGDVRFQQVNVVVEIERHLWKANRGTHLLGQLEILPAESKLANQLGQRTFLGSLSWQNWSSRGDRRRSRDPPSDRTNSSHRSCSDARECRHAGQNVPSGSLPPTAHSSADDDGVVL